MRLKIAAIVEAGQRIDHRQFDRRLNIKAQTVGVALAPNLGAHARQHLVAVDGAQQIIIHAQIEAAQDALAVFDIGQHQQGRMAGAFNRAKLSAQAQAVEIGEIQADEGDLVIGLGGAKKRLFRVGFDIDLIGAAQRPGGALG